MSNPETRTLVVERDMPHPAEKVWRALTRPALIADWLMDNDFQPMVGHRFTFRADLMPHWNGVTDCEVLVVDPNRKLSYTWNSSGDEAANGMRTVVTWTLTPIDGGVRVRMEQSGFRVEQTRNYQGAHYGWNRNFERLQQVAGSAAAAP